MDLQQVGLDGAAQASDGCGGGSETVERKSMGLELIYTSARKGLKPGSVGFCTVAMSRQMPPALAATLESLSGYRHLYTAGNGDYAENPVNFCHYLVPDRGRVARVLARIGAAPADYTGRTNKLAHFLVLDPAELALAGPAWLLGRPGLMQELWQGEPRWIDPPLVIPNGDSQAARCAAWERVNGDAGWAGELLRRFCEWPDAPVHVVCKPGTPTLELFAEALALLPPDVRWRIGFSTYFTGIPAAGVKCHWRGIIAGTAAAEGAIDPKSVIDLSRPLGRAPDGSYNVAAREGRIVDLPTVSSPATPRETPITLAGTPELSERKAGGTKPIEAGLLDLAPLDAKPRATRFFHPHKLDQPNTQPHTRRKNRWILPAVLGAVAFVIVMALGVWFVLPHLESMGQLGQAMLVTGGPGRSTKTGRKVQVPAKPPPHGPKALAPAAAHPGGTPVPTTAKAGAAKTVGTARPTAVATQAAKAEKVANVMPSAQAQFLANSRMPPSVLNEPIFEGTSSGLVPLGHPAKPMYVRVRGIESFLVRLPPALRRGTWALKLGDKQIAMRRPYVLESAKPTGRLYSVWWVPNPASGAGLASAFPRRLCTISVAKRGGPLEVQAEKVGGRNSPDQIVVDVRLISGRRERIQFLAPGKASSKYLNHSKVIPLSSETPEATEIASSLKSLSRICLVKESLYPQRVYPLGRAGKKRRSFSIGLAVGTVSGARRWVLKFNLAHGKIFNNFGEIDGALHIRLGHWTQKTAGEAQIVEQYAKDVGNREKNEPAKRQTKDVILSAEKNDLNRAEGVLASDGTRKAHVTRELERLNALKSITFRVDLYPGGPVLERFTFKRRGSK